MELRISYGIERECAFFSHEKVDHENGDLAEMAFEVDNGNVYHGTSAYIDHPYYEIITLPAYNLNDAVRSAWDIDARQKRICDASDGRLMAFKGNTSLYGRKETFATHDNFILRAISCLSSEIALPIRHFATKSKQSRMSNMVVARAMLCGEGGYDGKKILHSPRINTMIANDMCILRIKDDNRVHINASMDNCSPISTGLRLVLGGIIAAYACVDDVYEESPKWPKNTADTKNTMGLVSYLRTAVEGSRSLEFVPPHTDIALELLDIIDEDLASDRVPLYLDWGAKHTYLSQFVKNRARIRAMAEDTNWCRLDRDSTWHRLKDHCLSDPRIKKYVKQWGGSRRFSKSYRRIIKDATEFSGGALVFEDGSLMCLTRAPLEFVSWSRPSQKSWPDSGKCFVLPYYNMNDKLAECKIIEVFGEDPSKAWVKMDGQKKLVSRNRLIRNDEK